MYHPSDSTSVYIGQRAGKNIDNSSFKFNTFLGQDAGLNSVQGSNNTFLGRGAGFNNVLGSFNTLVGRAAGSSSISGFSNTCVGWFSGHSLTTGSGNTFIGDSAGDTLNADSDNNICIGSGSGPFTSIQTSQKLYIDVLSSNRPLIYGEFDNNLLRIHGDFEVNNSNGNVIRVDDTNGNLVMNFGRLGVGIQPGNFKLNVNGTAAKSTPGDWAGNSDARLKKDVLPLDSQVMLNKVLAMQGVFYEWNDDKTGIDRPEGVQIGFIAQDLQEVWPEKINEDEQGYLHTAYGDYDPILVEAIKAQQKIIDDLIARMEALEKLLAKELTSKL